MAGSINGVFGDASEATNAFAAHDEDGAPSYALSYSYVSSAAPSFFSPRGALLTGVPTCGAQRRFDGNGKGGSTGSTESTGVDSADDNADDDDETSSRITAPKSPSEPADVERARESAATTTTRSRTGRTARRARPASVRAERAAERAADNARAERCADGLARANAPARAGPDDRRRGAGRAGWVDLIDGDVTATSDELWRVSGDYGAEKGLHNTFSHVFPAPGNSPVK